LFFLGRRKEERAQRGMLAPLRKGGGAMTESHTPRPVASFKEGREAAPGKKGIRGKSEKPQSKDGLSHKKAPRHDDEKKSIPLQKKSSLGSKGKRGAVPVRRGKNTVTSTLLFGRNRKKGGCLTPFDFYVKEEDHEKSLRIFIWGSSP